MGFTTTQAIMYGIFAGVFGLVVLVPIIQVMKPTIIKIYKKYKEGKKNVQEKGKNTGNGSSSSTNATSNKQPDTNNTGRIQRFEIDNGEQQSVGSEHESSKQTKQYKSIFE
jgi:hypothetical protein